MDYLENIPNTLYKYRIWDNQYQKRILIENEVFLSSPANFNDPFDVAIPYRFKESELTEENILKKLFKMGKRVLPDLSEIELQNKCIEVIKSDRFENGKYWKEKYEKFKKQDQKLFGILSLTSKRDNLLMWSHYSNSHQGFCVGFDKFILDENIKESILGPIIYDTVFPEISLFESDINGILKTQMTKSKEWAYEEEYRITKWKAANTTIKLPPESIKEVVLGLKMKNEYKKEIIILVKKKFPNAILFQSKMNLEVFKLDMEPIE
ncbi:MAG: DUF2971 domain-containing protein [Spirosomataceae bacterium]|jgi:hypothetical protein